MNRDLIEHYAHGGEKLALAIRGLTVEDLLAPPPTDPGVGKWTIQQVVLHLADCEGVHADRIKRVIAEDNPTLLAFDETRWAAALHYAEQSAEDAVNLVELTRRQLAIVLRKLPDSAFQRSGTHNQAGKKTLADLIQTAADHLEHHVKFIHAKRAKMGKEMW
jgi:predicted metallo-beta-lactamase superfamily hydrolase